MLICDHSCSNHINVAYNYSLYILERNPKQPLYYLGIDRLKFKKILVRKGVEIVKWVIGHHNSMSFAKVFEQFCFLFFLCVEQIVRKI